METPGTLAHFLDQSDTVGRMLFAVLAAMSVTTWYFILVKSLRAVLVQRRSRAFLANFWNASSLDQVASWLGLRPPNDPFSRLTFHALAATRHHARHGANRLNEAGTAGEFLTRSMRRIIDEETAALEWGFTILASIASTAPFIGLFGTVWGVYHALVKIGASGSAGLEQIAGPVGEALIMTGTGLAVAIPAVLAFNAFARSNRLVLARLDGFAHDLFAFLTTGAHMTAEAGGQLASGPVTPIQTAEGGL